MIGNILAVALEKGGAIAVALATNALLARSLGPNDYGALQYALSVVFSIGAAGLIASAQATAPVVARTRQPARLYAAIWDARLFACIACISAVLAVGLLTDNKTILVLSLLCAAEPLATSTLFLYANGQKFRIATVRTLGGMVRLASLAPLLLLSKSVTLAAGAWLVEALFVGATLSWRYFAELKESFILSGRIGRHFPLIVRRGVIAWPGVFIGMLVLRSDRLVMNASLDPPIFGAYAAAATVLEQWNTVGMMLAQIFAARTLYKIPKSDKAAAKRALRTLLLSLALIGVVGFLILALAGGTLIHIVFGGRFEQASQILTVGAFASIFVYLDAALSTALLQTKQGVATYSVKQLILLTSMTAPPLLLTSETPWILMYSGQIVAITAFWIFRLLRSR